MYREETYLTNDGFKDFEIRPALQAILLPAEGSNILEPTNVNFEIEETDENGLSL